MAMLVSGSVSGGIESQVSHLSKLPPWKEKVFNFFGGSILCVVQKVKKLGFG